MHEITDIFSDSDKQNQTIDLNELNITYPTKSSVCNRISCLSDVFMEWYLFDSSSEKDIKKFLSTENLTDVFTELEFMDIMCGNAYIDDNLIQFILLKLPFRITSNRLHMLNKTVSTDNFLSYKIQSKPGLSDKLIESFQIKQQIQKEKYRENRKRNKERTRKVKHEYYLKNKEYIQQLKHSYYLKNQDLIKQRSKEYYNNNKDRIKEYYVTNKEHRKNLHHEYYVQNKERISERNKAYYKANKEKQKQYLKEYYIAHSEKQKQYIKEYYAELKQNKAMAQTMCAAYIFLSKLKKENQDKYLELYRKHQTPLHGMLKTCIALQNKDINMCPLYNDKCENVLEQNCNQKVLSLPNAIIELQTIASNLNPR